MKLTLPFETRDDGVVTLWIKHPERSVNVLDSWLLDQLHLFFDELDKNATPRGLIIMSGNPKAFIAGADLEEISTLSDTKLHAYLTEGADAFARISALPCPTVAAIAGAALGGGLELALHCDGVIASAPAIDAKPYALGLPEASLGICPGWGGTQMLPARIDPAQAILMMASGETRTLLEFPPGLIDRIVDNEDDLHEAALHWVETQSELTGGTSSATPKHIDESDREHVAAALNAVESMLPKTPAAHAVVEAVRIGMEEGFAAGCAAERRLLVSLRHTPEARERIAKFFARNAKTR